jgi:methylphosphotriester-DNA--protein-cysteine methyltransferase
MGSAGSSLISAPRSTVPDRERLHALVTAVGAFYVRDRALRRSQQQIETALAAGEPDSALVRAYLGEVRRYFEGFAREAAGQLTNVDRTLERLYQEQYNMTAERAVAARRVEAVQGVLGSLAEIGGA